ncbi:MAG TPA: metallopeptidase family protein [Candidatus Paceibacterota bacterium]|nr:metallopeptidase family protein [Candidatus Paceibacterota bacterium]
MEKKDFEQLVVEAFDNIPEKFRKEIKNVALTIEDEPTAEDLAQRNLQPSSLLLGLYVGIPATERGANYGIGAIGPDVIKIFQKSIEKVAGDDLEQIREIVKETVWHEYAHYFGMDEEEVRKWENQKREKK